jgi:hypothetical protein
MLAFCAVASVGKLCLKKLLRSILIFNKTIEPFLTAAILSRSSTGQAPLRIIATNFIVLKFLIITYLKNSIE